MKMKCVKGMMVLLTMTIAIVVFFTCAEFYKLRSVYKVESAVSNVTNMVNVAPAVCVVTNHVEVSPAICNVTNQVNVAPAVCAVTNQLVVSPAVCNVTNQVNVAPTTCTVTNHVTVVVPKINSDVLKTSFALLGEKVIEAEKMRIDYYKKREEEAERMKRKSEEAQVKTNEVLRAIEIRYAKNALFYINHFNMVVSKITSYNNPMVLEEEYNAISMNSIRLDTIKDVEVIDIIQEIMDYITEMRLQERARTMLKNELDQGMSDALMDSLSGISTGGAVSPLGMAANLVTSAACAGITYQKVMGELKNNYKKEVWTLDNEKIKEVNDLNKHLLRKYWQIIQRYKLNDDYRVTEEGVKRFFARLKDEDENRRYRFLKQNEKGYSYLPIYWFYRGETAYKMGKYDDAEIAFDTYQKNHIVFDDKHEKDLSFIQNEGMDMYNGKILRCDSIAAKVAMLRAENRLAMKKSEDKITETEKEFFMDQINIIHENTFDEEWSMRYYAACLCGKFGNIEKAKEVLQPTIDELESRRDVNYKTLLWEDLQTADNVYENKLIAPGDALMRCKQLLLELEVNMNSNRSEAMKKLCMSESASVRDKIFMYGAMRYKDALEQLLPDIMKIKGSFGVSGKKLDGTLVFDFPKSWIISREGKMEVRQVKNLSSDAYKKGGKWFGDNKNSFKVTERKIEGRGSCRIIFGDGKDKDGEEVKAKENMNTLLKIDYDIRRKKGQGVRIVLEYHTNGLMLELKRAVMGLYDTRDPNKGDVWIDCDDRVCK